MNRLRIALLGLALAGPACRALAPPGPTLEWDPAPEAVVIEAYDSGGLVSESWRLNAIPIARVFGDGRIVWAEAVGARRQVSEGRLAPDEMRALLQQFVEAGFFGWEASYDAEALVYDGGTTTLRVNLLSTSKSVSAFFSGAPEAFDRLVGVLAGGAGAAGMEYVPPAGYLTALPLGDGNLAPDFVWPAGAAGFSLDQALDGRYLEGQALAWAWRVVNTSRYAIVESEAHQYELVVQVPGLSLVEPPPLPMSPVAD